MKMKKFLAMALTGVMCVGLLAGCSNGSSGTTSAPSGGSSASSTAGADGAIKIGGIGPLTGSAATYGIATKQGLRSRWTRSTPWAAIQLLPRSFRMTRVTLRRPSTPTTPEGQRHADRLWLHHHHSLRLRGC